MVTKGVKIQFSTDNQLERKKLACAIAVGKQNCREPKKKKHCKTICDEHR